MKDVAEIVAMLIAFFTILVVMGYSAAAFENSKQTKAEDVVSRMSQNVKR